MGITVCQLFLKSELKKNWYWENQEDNIRQTNVGGEEGTNLRRELENMKVTKKGLRKSVIEPIQFDWKKNVGIVKL